jgi:Flp pilus assembly protein TadB
MSKERARRRAERLVVEEREKAARVRRVARRQRRRALVKNLTPKIRIGSDGRLYHRSRRQRIGIVIVPLVAIAAVWLFIPDPALRLLLTVLLVLAAPALVVVVLGRRS